MSECLVVLTALRFSDEFVEAALQSARETGEGVLACLVVDPDLSEAVGDQLADTGFIGEKLKHDLHEAMLAEYRSRGLEHLNDLVRRAEATGLTAESRVFEGPFVDSVVQVAGERGVSRILVAGPSRPNLSRLVFGGEIKRLVKRASVPVQVFPWSRHR